MKRNAMTVYGIIKMHPGITNQGIAAELGWTINRVTPRTKELLDEKLIRVSGYAKTVYDRTARRYEVVKEEAAA